MGSLLSTATSPQTFVNPGALVNPSFAHGGCALRGAPAVALNSRHAGLQESRLIAPSSSSSSSWRGAASGVASLAVGTLLTASRQSLRRNRASRGPLTRARAFSTTATEAPAAGTILSESIKVPPTDERKYRAVQLANGMQVLLTSDETCDLSAAAITVKCGTFQDPDAVPGLAHFHEHMLFLGTEKYPKEDEYQKYLSENGGDSNAFTTTEYTTYYFKVPSESFQGALDRFAQFFVCPTFTESCVEREMNAVDSESTNYSSEDTWRLQQILKATASKNHPFSRFDVGNLSTLKSVDRQFLKDWNREHYQAGAMRLALVGRESLDELQRQVESLFGPVRPGDGCAFKYASKPWTEDCLQKIVHCVPIKEARAMSLCWTLPPTDENLFSKPDLYIAHFLGHEGAGSLHDLLNSLGWVDQLTAGPAQSFSDGQLFGLNISLTPAGDENRMTVLALALKWVELARKTGPQKAMFEELASLQQISFAHKEESPIQDDFVAGATHAMHRYPIDEVLRGVHALDEWKPELISEYFEMLKPENCIVFMTSSDFAGEAKASAPGWQREAWYSAPFKEQPLDVKDLEQYLPEGEELPLLAPQPNPFVPQDFSIRCTEPTKASKSQLKMDGPTLVRKSDLARVWHKTDCAFHTPRLYVMGKLFTPQYERGPRAVALTRLFCNIVLDDLNSLTYDATCAGLGYTVEFSDALTFNAGGFSDKLPLLLESFLGRLTDVVKDLEESELDDGSLTERGHDLLSGLEVQRQLLMQDYKNLTREEPWSVSNYYLGQMMVQGSWHLDEYRKALEEPIGLKDLAQAAREAFGQVQIELLVHGNATPEESNRIADKVIDCMKAMRAQALPEAKQRLVARTPCDRPLIFEYDLGAENPEQENSCTQNVYQVGTFGTDQVSDACLSIVTHIAHASAYQKLRTEEQLGYIVQAGPWVDGYVGGLTVLVQGNRLPPKEADLRIEAWLKQFGTEIAQMTDSEFETIVQAAVNERTQRLSSLSQETLKHWGEIATRRYLFDRTALVVEALRALKKEDVLQFFERYFSEGGSERRKVSVRVLGTSASDQPTTEACLHTLEDLRSYQATSDWWELPADVAVSSQT
eukprot:CAMPEP_0206432954 /NCGR_PEP_ID=MMETSP0324_2-20121206/8252_1 /ASSEMBLY_ACC=CAM_ASM_000836 /TAXON_ID=2866 /ORGANISM="Crypthecodinium cohnii, Strain Seligo" /LENGTH=1096 /DNA_ID=CAMNT_0053899141 /DNA_START=101 /DNA_END=3391 /DNA_ORIENTATION=+